MATKLPTSQVLDRPATCGGESATGACAEFVKFCKEQYLHARSAETFIRVLHNKSWESEVTHIREAMRPEVEKTFAPIEKALENGANCREVMAKLVEALKKPE